MKLHMEVRLKTWTLSLNHKALDLNGGASLIRTGDLQISVNIVLFRS
jgi:hypothetical protein